MPGAVNIPLDSLRERLTEIPRDKEIIAFCQVGLRGYIACRILAQHGYKVRNLSGGYKTWKASVSVKTDEPSFTREVHHDTGETD
jgi:rhodanese-related sulfurtransferase